MSEQVVEVKIEPPDDFDNNQNSIRQNGVLGNPEKGMSRSNADVDKRNFTCLLCDLVLESRDDLKRHLKVAHTSKQYFAMPPNLSLHHGKIPDSMFSGFSSYVNYRYTCTVCGAKFKAFRSYLTHSMSHRGTGSLRSQFDDARMASILTSGKQYLQDYIDSDDGLPSSFTCDECKTVFSQRDSYAMHMMMRAMNETCMSGVNEDHKVEQIDSDETSDKELVKTSISPRNRGLHQETSSSNVSLKSLEDVTSKVDQDEYLKSVLDRVFIRDSLKFEKPNSATKGNHDYKICTFCRSSFEDQDSLAMHVMSDHAEQIIPNTRNNSQVHLSKSDVLWKTPVKILNDNLTCKICAQTFISRDSLAMHVLAHTQENSDNIKGTLNHLKRSQTFDEFRLPNKTAKMDDHINRRSDSGTESILNNDNLSASFYCSECNIRFYTQSEFIWHNNKHHRGIASIEPLCLTKQPNELKENSGQPVVTKPMGRVRRNSFSFDEKSRSRDTVPRRPLSAGNVTYSQQRQQTKPDEDRATDLSQKSSRKNSVTSSLKALSSHEQKIIYSVFGKDLRLNIDSQKYHDSPNTSEEKKEKQKIKGEKTDHKVRSNNTKSPLNLNFEHARHASSAFTGYSNGDKDFRSTSSTIPKDAAMCKYCEILFLNKAIYYLHMGLHNVNNPWQCNVCGKACVDAVDFAAHVIHM